MTRKNIPSTCNISVFFALALISISGPSSATATQSAAATVYRTETPVYGYVRTFNFNGSQPFVNPITKQSDLGSLQFNGTQINGANITNAGSKTQHIVKLRDPQINNQTVTHVRLFPNDAITANSHRTQINTYDISPYKTYKVDLEFKLHPNWNFNMPNGDGLLWQMKSVPKAGQWGNPVMALVYRGNQLILNICYPKSAMTAKTWPTSVTWGPGEYISIPMTPRTLTAGKYHKISIEFFADDRPPQFGGKGYVKAWFDGVLWQDMVVPTLQPDQQGKHHLAYGIYQWQAAPVTTREISFRTHTLFLLRDAKTGIR